MARRVQIVLEVSNAKGEMLSPEDMAGNLLSYLDKNHYLTRK